MPPFDIWSLDYKYSTSTIFVFRLVRILRSGAFASEVHCESYSEVIYGKDVRKEEEIKAK